MKETKESQVPDQAQLEWDGAGQPISRVFGDVYFSRINGLAETRYVFLHHNHLAHRFTQLKAGDFFTIGETGFGTGLNFLATWELWRQTAPPDTRLHFLSAEKYPLTRADLSRALALWPELAEFATALLNAYPPLLNRGFHHLVLDQGRVRLTLLIDDATQGFAQLKPLCHDVQSPPWVDAWFLDGFAPAKNPVMWQDSLFTTLAHLSRPGTTAATFSAAGVVKAGLRNAGFRLEKVPGFGQKRDMIRAQIDTPQPPSPPLAETPWTCIRHWQTPRPRTAVIVGGGLAACHTARALAERGWQVDLLERHPRLAPEASGNPQGIVYARLSPKQEPLAAFNLACLDYALRHYQPYWKDSTLGEACGVLQLAYSAEEQGLQERLVQTLGEHPDLFRVVDQRQAGDLAGLHLSSGGIFFPKAGWINPPRLCQALVSHPSIRTHCATNALKLLPTGHGWEVQDHQGMVQEATVVVLANAADAIAFTQTSHLPLKTLRGQVTYLPQISASATLTTVICGEGYIAPAMEITGGALIHCTGATFNLKDQDPNLRVKDHDTNLRHLAAAIPSLGEAWEASALTGRVGFRCTTPDYLPVVGPAPKLEDFERDYAGLRKNARKRIAVAGSYWPGLYLNLGHGSRGLAYTPLCSELVAAQIAGEALPLEHSLVQALHPARFIIRDLQRNRR